MVNNLVCESRGRLHGEKISPESASCIYKVNNKKL